MFTVIKWGGVAYLAWMGLTHLLHAKRDVENPNGGTLQGPWSRFSQGFVTSASNPKAIVFFAALLPQFVNPAASATPIAIQFMVLGALFLVIDGSSVFLYPSTAGRLSNWLSRNGRIATQRRITGSVLLGAAALLSLKGVPATES